MLITASHITKYNQNKCILNDVSFTIHEHDKIALIGINGTGKSTLLKILANITDVEGSILRKKDLTVGYLPQNPDFQNHLTVLEQVYEYLDPKTPDYEIKSLLHKFKITDFHQKIETLSGGQQKRIALAITLLKPCDLLLLDEPTNHLDNEMVDYLEKYLIKFNKALFMVTHDRYFLERITNQIYELDRQQIYTYEANYSSFLIQKAEREEVMLATERKRKLFLKKELEWVRAGVQARTTKSKDRLQRFEELSNQKDIQTIKNVEMIHTASRLGKKTIELNHISMSYDQTLFYPFSYTFKQYDRIGIIGINGCGKSTLLNIIAGFITPSSGEVIIGDTVKLGYFKQGHGDMDPHLRVIDYIKETAQLLKTDEGTFSAKQMCEKFLFDTELQYTTISRLSGGEKRRLYLLKVLMEGNNILLLDEPTNDLDITTLQILEDYLDTFPGIVITVSHDRYFLDRICVGLLVFKDKTITYHNGGYSENIDITPTKEKQVKQKTYQKKRKNKLSWNEKKELEELEQQIPILEQNLKDIDQQLNETTDYQIVSQLVLQRDEYSIELEEKTLRWMELLEKQETSL
ncbi:MAG: ABC-F family ATP-binding cassette domain-containing protein [Erysipelotrichales bacterium]|nr:ABC-F family ATP-binding cassette domain-containing protein [Erysipelotrichales bacterium]